MFTLDIRRDPATDTGPRDALAQLAASVRRQAPELRDPITVAWSDLPVVALDHEVPWLYGPVDRDPLMGPGGPVALPRRQRRELEELTAGGVRFQAVTIAHELDPEGPAGSLLPLLRNGPRTCTDEVARELVGPVPAHPGVARTARILGSFVGGGARAAAGAIDLLLDPILFGVLAPTPLVPGAPSLWFPLVAWRW